MTADPDRWNELAEFVHCEPSPLAFRALVALLDTWPADDQTKAIEHAETLLRSWPDSDRMAPWSWCKAASKGAVGATWTLVRALQFSSGHLTKGKVNLARLAHYASLKHITELGLPRYSDFQEISFVYHHPELFPGLKKLQATDKYNEADVRALADSPLWKTLESFEVEHLSDSLVHRDVSRIAPKFHQVLPVSHLRLRSSDLITTLDSNDLPHLRSISVFIRSIEDAKALARREELSRITSLSIAFRCGFNGSTPFEPFLGNIIEADEAAAEAFFKIAKLDQLEKLSISGYSQGYWGREGMGWLGLKKLIASGLLHQLKHLCLEMLPLGDKGVATLAPALGPQLETLELRDVYCKDKGAAALVKSPCLPGLRHFDLSGNRIGAKPFVRLANVDMPHLEVLDFGGPGINPYYWNIGQQPMLDAGAVAWANSPNVRQLKRLNLQNCFLTDESLAAMFQSSELQNLEELDLSHSSFTAAGVSQSVVDSPLWRSLRELGLNNCRLDNAAMEALSRVPEAPRLRCLDLGYNSIGPKGASALAQWPVLARVLHLGLHDNVIGDEGLIAIAQSPYTGRLLELDLEQDCWNSRTFSFDDDTAKAVANSEFLGRLDGLFSGVIDEYHGAAYSPGFTKEGLEIIRKSPGIRPGLKASCSDFSEISDYSEYPKFNEDAELGESDFRLNPTILNTREAKGGRSNMRQLRSPNGGPPAFDESKPPKIQLALAELDFNEKDIIEGLEFRDPTVTPDFSLSLTIALEDIRRPLPTASSKMISDTLNSIFNARSIGRCEYCGGSSRPGDDGQFVDTETRFSVGISGDAEVAARLIRETLWWIGAPESTVASKQTDFDDSEETDANEFPLRLADKPASSASHFVQLASPKIVRWKIAGKPGYRIDRVPFSPSQRQTITKIFDELGDAEYKGWKEISTQDEGCLTACTKYLDDSTEFDTFNILIDDLTPDISLVIYKLMEDGQLMLFPMAFAPSQDVAETLEGEWPQVEIVKSAAALYQLLAAGPYERWNH